MHSFYDILVQAIGFLGLLFFFISFQVKTNKRFFVMQTLGCLTFSLQFALLTWSGPISLLPVATTVAGTIGYWTNNARNIRIANLAVNSPCMLLYDVLVKSWGGALNEAVTLVSIIISIIRFGWKALDGDRIEA